MNLAEEAARPLATQMMEGAATFGATEQRELAFWGSLKALVAHRAMRSSGLAGLVPAQDYLDFQAGGETRTPPSGFLVHMGRSAWSVGQAPAGFFRFSGLSRDDREEGDEFDGYGLIYTMLDLVIMVVRVFFTEPTRFIPFDDQRFAEVIARVWPVTPEGVIWPPDAALTGRGLEELSGGSL